jgi:hypothetical protein
VRGGNWDSSCNDKGFESGGWYVCGNATVTGGAATVGSESQNIVNCSFQGGSGSCKGTNSEINGVGWNNLTEAVCCDGNWWITGTPHYNEDGYVDSTNWTGDCNGVGNGLQTGGFYKCGETNNNATGGTPAAGSVLPIRWRTSGFAGPVGMTLSVDNISFASINHPSGASGVLTEAYDSGSNDLTINADMIPGQYYVTVTACDQYSAYPKQICASGKSSPFTIMAASTASQREVTTCVNAYCTGTNSILTEVSNGNGRSNSVDYIDPATGANWGHTGTVCCDGDWWVDTRGSNWDSACNGSKADLTTDHSGWYACSATTSMNTITRQMASVIESAWGAFGNVLVALWKNL